MASPEAPALEATDPIIMSEASRQLRKTDEQIVRRRFILVVVFGTLTSMINFLDRSVLNILAEPIKRDLGFSDTQLGLLTGFAFALFYSLAGIPIARYVDRPTTNRPTVIAVCMSIWSAMTALSGLVTSYGQLLAARILVAAGESGSGPAIITLIDHYVPRSMRSRVFAIYGLGVPFGTLLGLVLGGWLVDLIGWRMTFVALGVPGLILALVIRLILHEPRTDRRLDTATRASVPTLRENLMVILQSPALFWLTSAAAIGGLFVLGLPSWSGVYLIRVLDLSATQTGVILGLTSGIAGGLGTYFGGVFADKLSKKSPGGSLLVPCIGLLIGMPAALVAFLTDDWRIFAASYWIFVLGASTYIGPLFSLLQILVKPNYRATTLVIVVMLANLIGAGLGPLLIGVGSDLLSSSLGQEGLRWVLIAGHLLAFIPAYFYLKAKFLVEAAVQWQD